MSKLRAVWCALFGHTRATDGCMGYQYCARCKAQVGDTLGGIGRANVVGMGCGCNTCREAWGRAEWHERVLLPEQPKFTGLTRDETTERDRREMAAAVKAMQAELETLRESRR